MTITEQRQQRINELIQIIKKTKSVEKRDKCMYLIRVLEKLNSKKSFYFF